MNRLNTTSKICFGMAGAIFISDVLIAMTILSLMGANIIPFDGPPEILFVVFLIAIMFVFIGFVVLLIQIYQEL